MTAKVIGYTNAGAAAYTHTQAIPAAVWTVDHSLTFRPNVTVVDTAGSEVEGEVEYLSDTQIRLTFEAPFAGFAYLS